MHGNTFNSLKPPYAVVATVWGNSTFRGRLCTIVDKWGVGKMKRGKVLVRFADDTTAWEPYESVALGDNATIRK